MIDYPFIHLDNDLIINDITKLKIKQTGLNLGYKHTLREEQEKTMLDIFKLYSSDKIKFFANLKSVTFSWTLLSVNIPRCGIGSVIRVTCKAFSNA